MRREKESPANGRLKRKNESKRTRNLVVQEPTRKSLIESEDLAGRGRGRGKNKRSV